MIIDFILSFLSSHLCNQQFVHFHFNEWAMGYTTPPLWVQNDWIGMIKDSNICQGKKTDWDFRSNEREELRKSDMEGRLRVKLNSFCSSKEPKGKATYKSMRGCTGPRLGTILCRQLAFAFQLSSPILLLLSSCFLHPVLSLSLSLSRLQHLHFTGMLTRQNKTLWFDFCFFPTQNSCSKAKQKQKQRW